MEALPPITVSGTVIANDSLKPIANVEVTATPYGRVDTTDGNGRYSILHTRGTRRTVYGIWPDTIVRCSGHRIPYIKFLQFMSYFYVLFFFILKFTRKLLLEFRK